jgi:hypothetical protein
MSGVGVEEVVGYPVVLSSVLFFFPWSHSTGSDVIHEES